jgi:hypothetical protein
MGCSRTQKLGATISAQDVAKAMPEFTLVMPPGAAYVFLERFSNARIGMVYLKLTVPRTSLTNFLSASGLNGPLMPMPGGAFVPRHVPLPRGLNVGSVAANLVADVCHADQWDPGKGNTPLLMGTEITSAKSSPSDQAMLLILLDNSTSPQAKVYLQYCRGPKRR